ncbi:MAG: hypothetical protein O3C40_13885 [Planctomycetota bacterium]|nr:hypothetical protein [Planctomycetota bacterium]
MPIPFDEILFSPSSPLREIENHYHLRMIARDTAEVVSYQKGGI